MPAKQNFVYLDKFDLTTEETHDFFTTNQIICKFNVLYEIDLEYLVYLWNSREEMVTYKRQLINVASLTKQNKRNILIFLQQYFWGGLYIHPSFGLKFQNYISDRFYRQALIGKQILFAQIDNQKEKGFMIPKRNFKVAQVEHNYSQKVQRMIRKIILGSDWIEVCLDDQCMIMKNAIKYP